MTPLTTKAAEIRAGLVAVAYVYDPGAGSAMDKLLWARDRAFVEADCERRGGSFAPLYGEAVVAPLLALIEQQAAELAEARKERDREERAHLSTIDQRDRAEQWADKLAQAIGGDAIGEHSNLNCPWSNALEIATTAESERDELLREKERLGAGWRDLSTVPEDEMVIVATTGGWVGEATVIDREWKWAAGNVFHPDIVPLKWMPLPQHPDVMAEADELPAACLTSAEQKQQASRCACRGADDYCPCQNAPDATTIRARSALAPLGEE